MQPIHVEFTKRGIVLAVLNPVPGSATPEFDEAVARVCAVLDAAGIRYNVSGFTARVEAPLPLTRRHKSVRRRTKRHD